MIPRKLCIVENRGPAGRPRFAALIWGDDLVIRNGMWAIGNPDNCYDRAQGAKRLATVMCEQPLEALRLLRNRYRILLSRGIFSTTVYCEDEETQQFLRRLLG